MKRLVTAIIYSVALAACPSFAFLSSSRHVSASATTIIRRRPLLSKDQQLLAPTSHYASESPSSLRMMESLFMTDTATRSSSYLVRIVFLRAMALVHVVAFWIALRQNKALIGDDGITPARVVLDKAQTRGNQARDRRDDSSTRGTHLRQVIQASKQHKSNPTLARLQTAIHKFREVLWDRCDAMGRPVISLLWLAEDRTQLNPWLDGVAIAGLSISALIFMLGAANIPLVFGLWLCQRSLMSVGGPFYGFGWEPQLNELSFHAMFLVPLLSLKQIPHLPVSPIIAWTIRWMLFRIMMGAGLIKFRSGDYKWRDATAMEYFYETQPVPNPLSRYFHWMPRFWHKLEVWVNHFVETVAPWLLIVPGMPASWLRAAGLIQLAFQSVLITSGTLSFLNWLTMVPAIMCLDDGFVGRWFSPSMRTRAMGAAWTYQTSAGRQLLDWSFLGLVVWLSVPVVKNLLSKNQVMNASFDPLRLINTYGAFGTVSEEREEFIISAAPDFDGPWKEYEFKAKPGCVTGRPRWISPYHYRLDWQMWIASACRSLDSSPWLLSLLSKLLQQNKTTLKLLADDPWKGYAEKPKYIRVDRYRYRFHKPKWLGDPIYWDREFVGRVYPRQGLATLEGIDDEMRRLKLHSK